MMKTESKKWSQIIVIGIVVLLLFRKFIFAGVVAVIQLFDVFFGASNPSIQVIMWVIGGALIGGIYGSAAAIKKYRIPQKELLLPAGALALFILISFLRH